MRRPFNGIVSRFSIGQRVGRGLNLYRVRIVPALWSLTRTSDCRIFQEKSVPQIVNQVLTDFGVSQKSWKVTGEHAPRTYCVQYRETAFDFICRVLEEEGICFYFLHEDGSHTVVFSDNNRGLTKCSDPQVVASPDVGAMGGVWEWENAYHIRSSRWAISDYNSETPSTKLNVQKNTINPVLGKHKYEIFD